MPCKDDYPIDYKNTTTKNLDPLLCEACDLLEKHGLLIETSKELQTWAKLHEKKEYNRIRVEALAKLSPKERRALGL